MIHTAAEDSAKIVARLREFYRYREENDVFTPVLLNDLIQQVISLTQPRWKDQAQANGVFITMKTDLQNIPTISGNEAELREMLFNIVFNAIDAIPERGDDHLPHRHARRAGIAAGGRYRPRHDRGGPAPLPRAVFLDQG